MFVARATQIFKRLLSCFLFFGALTIPVLSEPEVKVIVRDPDRALYDSLTDIGEFEVVLHDTRGNPIEPGFVIQREKFYRPGNYFVTKRKLDSQLASYLPTNIPYRDRKKLEVKLTPIQIDGDYLVLERIPKGQNQGLQPLVFPLDPPANIRNRTYTTSEDLIVETDGSSLRVWLRPVRLSQLLANVSQPGERERARWMLDFLANLKPDDAAWKGLRPGKSYPSQVDPSKARSTSDRILHITKALEHGSPDDAEHRQVFHRFREAAKLWLETNTRLVDNNWLETTLGKLGRFYGT